MSSETRDPETRILDAAAAVFAELGVERARMGHVAERAGYARASLYRHFPTKEALVAAYARRALEQATDAVLARIETIPRLGDRLVEAMASGVEAMQRTPAIRPFLAPESHGVTLALAVTPEALGPRLLPALLRVVTEHDGQERLRSDLPAPELLEWVVRLIVSLALAPGDTPEPQALRAKLGRLVRPAFVLPAGAA